MKLTNSLFLFLAICLYGQVNAGVIYTNDFDTEMLGSTPTGFLHAGGGGSHTEVADDGTGNQVLELTSNASAANGYAFGNFNGAGGSVYESVTTFSFDITFDECTTQIRMRARDTAFSGGATDVTRFDLNSGSITAGTTYHFDYVVNNSTAAATAPVVGGTIASGTFAVYQDGVLLNPGATNHTAGDDLAVDKLTLWVRGTLADTAAVPPVAAKQGTVLIDNFEVSVNMVPEPTSFVLFGLGGLALLGCRRWV